MRVHVHVHACGVCVCVCVCVCMCVRVHACACTLVQSHYAVNVHVPDYTYPINSPKSRLRACMRVPFSVWPMIDVQTLNTS